MRLLGTQEDTAIAGDGPLEGHTNYLLGNDAAHWLRGLPNYSKVRYRQLYPGTDLVFYGNGGVLEHDFELQPEADPSRIAFRLDHARTVRLDHAGNLRIGLADGAITFERPVAYQMVGGRAACCDAHFRWATMERYAFGWADTIGPRSWLSTRCSPFPRTFLHLLRMRI